ncbi:hypothetical protein PSPO01_16110 [Paraphaeosphaeria sporulosa]
MEPEDIAAFTEPLGKLTPGLVLKIPEFLSRGDERECARLLPKEFRRVASHDYVTRQAFHASQQQEHEPREVNLQAGLKLLTDAAQPDTQATTQSDTTRATRQSDTTQATAQADATQATAQANETQATATSDGTQATATSDTTQATAQASIVEKKSGRKRPIRTAEPRARRARTTRERKQDALRESPDRDDTTEPDTGKKPDSVDPEEAKARQEYWDSKRDYKPYKLAKLRRLANGLAEVETATPEGIQGLWAEVHMSEGLASSGIAHSMDHTVRAYILCHLLSQVKDKTLVGRFEERFFTLCFGHEIDQIIRSTSFTGSVGRDSTTFAFDEVTKKYNIDRKTVEERYQDAKLLLECAKVGGAGTLLTMKNVMS